MHKEQKRWCERIKRKFQSYFVNKKVLDIGSLDINGNNKYLFEKCEYVGLDVLPGKNVDIVSVAHEYPVEDGSFEVVLSTNALEHDLYYSLTLKKMVALLKSDGLMFFSVSYSHEEHGTLSHHPYASATAHLEGEWPIYYKNLTENDIREVIDLEKTFKRYQIGVNKKDLQFWGIKI